MRSSCTIVIISVLIALLDDGHCAERKWLPNANILNRRNWLHNDANRRCYVFPRMMTQTMVVDSLTTSKITLPIDGALVINPNATITFLEERASDDDCVKIKQPEQYYSWFDARNWNDVNNNARVDVDRIPCDHDTIVIDSNATFDIALPEFPIRVREASIFSHRYLESGDDIALLDERSMLKIVAPSSSELPPCHATNQDEIFDLVCDAVRKYRTDDMRCSNPIQPPGHCTKMCGMFVNLKHGTQSLPKLVALLTKNGANIDYYIQSTTSNNLIVIVADKQRDNGGFHTKLLGSDVKQLLINERDYQLVQSGDPLIGGQTSTTTFLIVAITLLTNLLLFGALYAVYHNDLTVVKSLLHRTDGMRPFLFARFENRDDGELRFESDDGRPQQQYHRTSIVSVDKSFDNPMFGMAATTADIVVDDDVADATELQHYDDEGIMDGNKDVVEIENESSSQLIE